jgi:hypothetical protein
MSIVNIFLDSFIHEDGEGRFEAAGICFYFYYLTSLNVFIGSSPQITSTFGLTMYYTCVTAVIAAGRMCVQTTTINTKVVLLCSSEGLLQLRCRVRQCT